MFLMVVLCFACRRFSFIVLNKRKIREKPFFSFRTIKDNQNAAITDRIHLAVLLIDAVNL